MKTLKKNQGMKDLSAMVNERKAIHGMSSIFTSTFFFLFSESIFSKYQHKGKGNQSGRVIILGSENKDKSLRIIK